jgi:hypothetical protein
MHYILGQLFSTFNFRGNIFSAAPGRDAPPIAPRAECYTAMRNSLQLH